MARTTARLPAGSRITDFVSLGVIAKTFPIDMIRAILSAAGRGSIRERDLLAHVVMYYVIPLAPYMQSSAREVLRLSAGRPPMADRPVTGDQGAVQIRRLTGSHAARLGAGARTARSSGTADCGGNHARRLVSAMAAGQPGRQHARCGRRSGERGRIWPSRVQPRAQRLSANPLCLPA